jgi:hypothetical protein
MNQQQHELNLWFLLGTLISLVIIGCIGNLISVRRFNKKMEAKKRYCTSCKKELEHFDFDDTCNRCKYVY